MSQIFPSGQGRAVGPYETTVAGETTIEPKWCCGMAEMYGLDTYGATDVESLVSIYRGIIARNYQRYKYGLLLATTGERTPALSVEMLEALGFQRKLDFRNNRPGYTNPLVLWWLEMKDEVWAAEQPKLPETFREVDAKKEHYVASPK